MWRALAICLLLAGPAWAQDRQKVSNEDLYPPMPGVEYFCRDANGTRFELGAVICISASCQTWIARCDKSLNSTTWRKIGDGCPTADAGILARMKALG